MRIQEFRLTIRDAESGALVESPAISFPAQRGVFAQPYLTMRVPEDKHPIIVARHGAPFYINISADGYEEVVVECRMRMDAEVVVPLRRKGRPDVQKG